MRSLSSWTAATLIALFGISSCGNSADKKAFRLDPHSSDNSDSDTDNESDADSNTSSDTDADGDGDTDADADVDADADTAYTCPDTVPDSDLTDGVAPSCASESADHIECTYNGNVSCICGAASAHVDMTWQCVTCPETAPAGGDTCEVTDLECDYDTGNCVCERSGTTRVWNCGDSSTDVDADTDADADTDTSSPYSCPDAVPDTDTTDDSQPSCADESADHVNCGYDGNVFCICGGALAHENMVWQCGVCPDAAPATDDSCDVTGLECSYETTACVCERIDNTTRGWLCE